MLAASSGTSKKYKLSDPRISEAETLRVGPSHKHFMMNSKLLWWTLKLDNHHPIDLFILFNHSYNHTIQSAFKKSKYYYLYLITEEIKTQQE